MLAIFKKDIRSYFITPIGYVFLAIFYAIAGYYFFGYQLYAGSTDFSNLFSTLFTLVIFITPILTMKMFSEEKRHKTDQGLLTAPISITKIVLGKYFAAVVVFLLAMSITLVFFGIVSTKGTVETAVFAGHFIGMFLLGSAFCAVGMFVSVLTDSQVIAAIGTMGFGIFFLVIEPIGSMLGNRMVEKICTYLSFNNHYLDFTKGLLNIADVVFFVSIAILFNFLTIRFLDKKRFK